MAHCLFFRLAYQPCRCDLVIVVPDRFVNKVTAACKIIFNVIVRDDIMDKYCHPRDQYEVCIYFDSSSHLWNYDAKIVIYL